jgi:FkbM family methyltransferase
MAPRWLKHGVKNLLRRRGLRLLPWSDYEDRLAPVRWRWLRELGIHTIVDVGASDGGFARQAREILPGARLYCFEPLAEPFSRLQQRFADDGRVTAVNLALRDVPGTAEFHENESSGSSSLLPMEELHRQAYPFTARTTRVSVECSTLDAFFAERTLEREIWLKLDVQGGERLVLTGGRELLRGTRLVYIEMSFYELYERQPLANDIVSLLDAAGFALVGVDNVSQSLVDGRFLQADGYFLRREG